MTIGRSESANIRLNGTFVSRIHARIICSDDEAIIEDAGSRNGFKINAVAVKRHTLVHGDVIGIGKLHFTFVDTEQRD
jgi:pSer/pThr/pTyr-binding forkhead associated (FHA) protein